MKVLKLTIQPTIGNFWTIGKGYNDFHREDGAAIVWTDNWLLEYWINANEVTIDEIRLSKDVKIK